MTTTARLNNLLLNQDWKRIYQTFQNADFKSYDFENLRRVIITYIRENYPEDFNDYIESSEYMALIDAIAFLGQSLSFRIDLASRENFIELAERKESVLRLARMLSYNAKRNIPASGLLKFDTISTTDNVLDANGRDLSKQIISWNDSTNPNWANQFITILNSAMVSNVEFGRSQGTDVIDGITTDQYRLNTTNTDVPIYSFTKSVAGRSMIFELLSTSFKEQEYLYEEAPIPGNQLGFIYRQDDKGAGSSNTGFFLMFKQGSLELADFLIDVPTSNEVVSVESGNINNDDVWLYSLDALGNQIEEWVNVPSLVGNNIAYNSIINSVRNIYNIVTKEDDKIDLVFADGIYGNLPRGSFRVYYRVSNGLSYSISPNELRNINISIPYINKKGIAHTLNISMSLKYTVSSSSPAESIDTIRQNAPAIYYTQNRMITGEDYNLAPLSSSQDILKVKSINRTSSGISRNFEIVDASGKYSKVNVFADDGILYKNESEISLSFNPVNRLDIYNFIKRSIEPVLNKDYIFNFYLTKFSKILFVDQSIVWTRSTSDINQSTGYFRTTLDNSVIPVGSSYTTSLLRYVQPNAMLKFIAPEGKSFKNGEIVDTDTTDYEQVEKIWVKVVKVVGDGTNAGAGVLSNGLGSIIFNDNVPSGAIAKQIIPKFVIDVSSDIETEIVNLVSNDLNFGLRYDVESTEWKIITSSNLNLINDFSLGKSGDITNTFLDSSWIISFVKDVDRYVVRIRTMDLIFGSIEQNKFYFDTNQKVYDARYNRSIKDQVKVLGINTSYDFLTPLKTELSFEISDSIEYDDGYQAIDEIKVSLADSDSDGVVDNPEQFEDIVGPDSQLNYLFFEEQIDNYGNVYFSFIENIFKSNSRKIFDIRQKESSVSVNDYDDGELVYFYDSSENVVKRVNKSTNTFDLEPTYRANIGRNGLKFQYIHNASVDRRIDPSSSNIIDIYLLTRSYDLEFRKYIAGTASEPSVPNSDQLRIAFGQQLNNIKSISDEIIYHSVSYKVLFGATAQERLQATFKVVKNSSKNVNDNDLKLRIILAINEFFDIRNWDFGDTFYLSELTTYVFNRTAPDISNIVIVPRQQTQTFGSLFEIKSRSDEIFISGATVDDIEIVPSISAAEIRVSVNQITSST